MKILWLYRYHSEYNFDHWLHMDFAEWLRVYTDGNVQCYGKYLHEKYPKFVVTPWEKELTMQKLHELYPFDIVIINTKSRMFENYLPPINPDRLPPLEDGCWLPPDFDEYKCPKVVIEEDYHWETDDNWYADRGINLILQRHYSQSLRDGKVKKIWLPFSVDTSVFTPNPLIIARERRICYMGGYTWCYIYRSRVKQILTSANLCVNFSNHHREERYIKSLQNFVAYISCSANVSHTPAKMFEIMSSGGILFTNRSPGDEYGLKKLFPDDSYVTYEEDFSDVIPQAQKIIANKEWADAVAQKGMEYVHEHHNHKVRIGQLLKILEQEFGLI